MLPPVGIEPGPLITSDSKSSGVCRIYACNRKLSVSWTLRTKITDSQMDSRPKTNSALCTSSWPQDCSKKYPSELMLKSVLGYYINKYYFPVFIPMGIIGNILSFLVSISWFSLSHNIPVLWYVWEVEDSLY